LFILFALPTMAQTVQDYKTIIQYLWSKKEKTDLSSVTL
jgi:hypothetical protein